MGAETAGAKIKDQLTKSSAWHFKKRDVDKIGQHFATIYKCLNEHSLELSRMKFKMVTENKENGYKSLLHDVDGLIKDAEERQEVVRRNLTAIQGLNCEIPLGETTFDILTHTYRTWTSQPAKINECARLVAQIAKTLPLVHLNQAAGKHKDLTKVLPLKAGDDLQSFQEQ